MSDEIQNVLRQMAEQIGRLSATVGSLEINWRNQDEKASQGRAALFQKIDDLREDFHGWRDKLEGVIEDVAEMKPTFKAVEMAKQRAIGAGMLGKALWAVGGAMVAGGVWLLSHIK